MIEFFRPRPKLFHAILSGKMRRELKLGVNVSSVFAANSASLCPCNGSTCMSLLVLDRNCIHWYRDMQIVAYMSRSTAAARTALLDTASKRTCFGIVAGSGHICNHVRQGKSIGHHGVDGVETSRCVHQECSVGKQTARVVAHHAPIALGYSKLLPGVTIFQDSCCTALNVF